MSVLGHLKEWWHKEHAYLHRQKIIQNDICLKQKNPSLCGMQPQRRRQHRKPTFQMRRSNIRTTAKSHFRAKNKCGMMQTWAHSPQWRSLLPNEIQIPDLDTQLLFNPVKRDKHLNIQKSQTQVDTLPSSSCDFTLPHVSAGLSLLGWEL